LAFTTSSLDGSSAASLPNIALTSIHPVSYLIFSWHWALFNSLLVFFSQLCWKLIKEEVYVCFGGVCMEWTQGLIRAQQTTTELLPRQGRGLVHSTVFAIIRASMDSRQPVNICWLNEWT
jgi:hypothetical protein